MSDGEKKNAPGRPEELFENYILLIFFFLESFRKASELISYHARNIRMLFLGFLKLEELLETKCNKF